VTTLNCLSPPPASVPVQSDAHIVSLLEDNAENKNYNARVQLFLLEFPQKK
jgi:hypothetical protein